MEIYKTKIIIAIMYTKHYKLPCCSMRYNLENIRLFKLVLIYKMTYNWL